MRFPVIHGDRADAQPARGGRERDEVDERVACAEQARGPDRADARRLGEAPEAQELARRQSRVEDQVDLHGAPPGEWTPLRPILS
jgi:hypothetical protein